MDNFLQVALKQAMKAYNNDDVPVGCVIVKKGKIISRAYNKKEILNNPLCHAEIIAINKACKKLKCKRLDECEMYVTLKPCIMCVGAIISSRIKKVYYGANIKGEQLFDYDVLFKYCNFYYLNNKQCSEILTNFFRNKRK